MPCCATLGYGFRKAPASPEKGKPRECVAKSESRGAVMVGRSRNAEETLKQTTAQVAKAPALHLKRVKKDFLFNGCTGSA